jgi:thiol-disulfide isomerase/thioredoxin
MDTPHSNRNFRTRTYRGLIAALVLGCSALAGASDGPAPDFTLPARSGSPVTLSELKGQVVMLNFWASWCGPCRAEFPLLDQMHKKYESLGLKLIGVNVETDLKDAERWLAQTPVSFPILFDKENKVTGMYAVNAMPSTVFIDRKGNVRNIHRGYKAGDESEYLNQIRALLKE